MTTTESRRSIDYQHGSATIDADGHVNETGHLADYIDPAHADILSLPPGTVRALNPAPEGFRMLSTWDPGVLGHLAIPGGSDGGARLLDMDREGIDAAVLYPTLLLEWREDPAGFGALCRAYNNWLRDYCSADPTRLFGVGAVPLQDVPAAIAEMERCLEELDFKAVFVRPAPYIGLRKLHDPVYDPFWDAAQRIGCPIGVHPYPMADMPNTVQLLALDDDSYGLPSEGLTLRQGLGNAMDMMMATGWFVAGGICERFPDLRVVILEGSGGWMPTMLERFDHQQKVFGNPYQKTPPSEVFRRQCWVSFDPDECALAFAAEELGADRIMWASDYPHPDAKIVGVVDELNEATEQLDPESRRRVNGVNAAVFYDL
jgi:predicted TIM-barrel fold metal-dependent hydrolase